MTHIKHSQTIHERRSVFY